MKYFYSLLGSKKIEDVVAENCFKKVILNDSNNKGILNLFGKSVVSSQIDSKINENNSYEIVFLETETTNKITTEINSLNEHFTNNYKTSLIDINFRNLTVTTKLIADSLKIKSMSSIKNMTITDGFIFNSIRAGSIIINSDNLFEASSISSPENETLLISGNNITFNKKSNELNFKIPSLNIEKYLDINSVGINSVTDSFNFIRASKANVTINKSKPTTAFTSENTDISKWTNTPPYTEETLNTGTGSENGKLVYDSVSKKINFSVPTLDETETSLSEYLGFATKGAGIDGLYYEFEESDLSGCQIDKSTGVTKILIDGEFIEEEDYLDYIKSFVPQLSYSIGNGFTVTNFSTLLQNTKTTADDWEAGLLIYHYGFLKRKANYENSCASKRHFRTSWRSLRGSGLEDNSILKNIRFEINASGKVSGTAGLHKMEPSTHDREEGQVNGYIGIRLRKKVNGKGNILYRTKYPEKMLETNSTLEEITESSWISTDILKAIRIERVIYS